MIPNPPIVANHTIMTGPNAFPTVPVPRLWIAKRQTKITTAIGMVYGAKMSVATLRPSTALKTEMAGVMMPSP